MTTTEQVLLADYTTLRLGGPAARLADAASAADLVEAVRAADARAEPVLVLGGGSNLVVADEGFPGLVVRPAAGEVTVSRADAVLVTASAGLDWDALVQRCLAEGLAGVECLSGIPGSVGATPVQNVGAYGQEVAQTISAVTAYDRLTGEVVRLGGADLGFGYRTSMFKRSGPEPLASATGRFVVLDVTFRLAAAPLSAPVRYGELSRMLGVPDGGRVPLADARAAVLELRRGKGMLLDDADPDSRSAGSFFTNPVVPVGTFAELAGRLGGDQAGRIPHWPEPGGQVKLSAAWLIERAGFGRGFALAGAGDARISTKHTLALTNPGGASTASLIELARTVRDGVRAAFGVELVSEPVLVGVRL